MAETPARNRRIRHPTYRTLDDGEVIEGTWRPVFIKNGSTYYLTDLKIYADGLIDCWGLVDLVEFREKVRKGWVATFLPEGGRASAHSLGTWTLHEPKTVSAQHLLEEVEETIADLRQQPTASIRCTEALSRYLLDRTEENRLALREAYFEIPERKRRYVLGDMDAKDRPLRLIVGEPGEIVQWSPRSGEHEITAEDRQAGFDYFEKRDTRFEEWKKVTHDGDDDGIPPSERHSSVDASFVFHGSLGWNLPDGYGFLSNSIPLPLVVDDITYPSLEHAYWALSTIDPEVREAIRLAEGPSVACKLALASERRQDWVHIRLAVMLDLLRRKFEQYPDLAEKLLATGDARIRCLGAFGTYWDTGADSRNWQGRALEVVRSELAMRRAQANS